MRTIVFDFDGVLIDSVDEVALTAFRAVDDRPVFSLDDLPSGFLEIFKRNRFLVQPAGDFLPFARWCLSAAKTSSCPETPLLDDLGRTEDCSVLIYSSKLRSSQFPFVRPRLKIDVSGQELTSEPTQTLLQKNQFDNLLKDVPEPLAERTEEFFASRKRLKDANPTYWFNLNTPYQPLWDALQRAQAQSQKNQNVVILTNKNRVAVTELCVHFQLPIQEQQVYSGDKGGTKIENLSHIKTKYGSTLFVLDDSVYNLLELKAAFSKQTNLSFALANWGYLGPGDIELAEHYGIASLCQKEVIQLLDETYTRHRHKLSMLEKKT